MDNVRLTELFDSICAGKVTGYEWDISKHSLKLTAEVVDDDDLSLWVDAKQKILSK